MAISLELSRFRVVRNIQAQKTQKGNAIDLSSLVGAPAVRDALPGKKPVKKQMDPDTFDHWLADLAMTLALRGNRMSPAEVQALLPKDWKRQVVADKWTKLKVDLAASLASAFADAASGLHPEKTETAEGLAGLLRLHSLVETSAALPLALHFATN
jgi:hypothetical protein